MRRLLHIRFQQTYALENGESHANIRSSLPVRIERAEPGNLLVGDLVSPAVLARFQKYLKEGQVGLVAVREGRIIGFAWAIFGDKVRLANGYFTLPPTAALIHHCRVANDVRGQRIYPSLLCAMVDQLGRTGRVARVLIDSAVRNHASTAGILRAGFRPIERVVYVQVLGRRILALHLGERRTRT